MGWIHIPSTETSYSITVPDNWKDYQFAISTNSYALQKSSTFEMPYEFKSMSSGMVWESCSRLHQTSMKNTIIIYFLNLLIFIVPVVFHVFMIR